MDPGRRILSALDWLAFTSLIPAGVAAGLLLAASEALGLAPSWPMALLAACGCIVVYNIDRLRDSDRDHATSPERTQFVDRHRQALWVATVLAGAACLPLAWTASREVVLLCAAVALPGLLHRRLTLWRAVKPIYVAAAWVAVTAGIPALAAPDASAVLWVASILAAAIGANLIASNLRESDPVPALLAAARALALIGLLGAAIGPESSRFLAAVPAAELAALAFFRTSERYRLLALDGALLIGALVSLAGRSFAA